MSNAALARIAGAQAVVSAQYLRPGKYRLEVQSLKTRDGFKGLSAIAELKVLSAEKTHENEPTKPGQIVSYVENLSDAKKNGGGRFKAFLMALAGASEEEMDLGMVAKYVGEKQPGAFLQVDVEVYPKQLPEKDGKPGKVIEGYRWSTVEIDEAGLTALNAKRAAARLPSFQDAIA